MTYTDELAELQVRRKFYIGMIGKQKLAMQALVRRVLGWRYNEEEAGRAKINARALRIVDAALKGKDQKPEDEEVFRRLAFDLTVTANAIEPYAKARHDVEAEMKRIVRELPVYSWAQAVHGLGDLGLAVIIAEAGDLANYPKKGHLWKRLGLAPYDGKAYSTWRRSGNLTKDEWIAAGYSPRRRGEIHGVVSDPLLRAQSVAKGPYRAIYDRRREKTKEKHPDWTDGHLHMDAMRVMTARLVRDLWVAWKAVEEVPQGQRLGADT